MPDPFLNTTNVVKVYKNPIAAAAERSFHELMFLKKFKGDSSLSASEATERDKLVHDYEGCAKLEATAREREAKINEIEAKAALYDEL